MTQDQIKHMQAQIAYERQRQADCFIAKAWNDLMVYGTSITIVDNKTGKIETIRYGDITAEISRAMTKLQETCRALRRRLERFVGPRCQRGSALNIFRKFLCRYLRIHDWRYASRYRKPGFESRAKCQWCENRKWVSNWQP